jgi:hypothetical protein
VSFVVNYFLALTCLTGRYQPFTNTLSFTPKTEQAFSEQIIAAAGIEEKKRRGGISIDLSLYLRVSVAIYLNQNNKLWDTKINHGFSRILQIRRG